MCSQDREQQRSGMQVGLQLEPVSGMCGWSQGLNWEHQGSGTQMDFRLILESVLCAKRTFQSQGQDYGWVEVVAKQEYNAGWQIHGGTGCCILCTLNGNISWSHYIHVYFICEFCSNSLKYQGLVYIHFRQSD